MNGPDDPQEVILANSLGLVRACRQIYVETILLLYRETFFHFTHVDILRAFMVTVPSIRMPHVRRLSLTWTIAGKDTIASMLTWPVEPENDPEWVYLWTTIGKCLIGLHELAVLLYTPMISELKPNHAVHAGREGWLPWMKPMLQVKGLKTCDIQIAENRAANIYVVDPESDVEAYRLRLENAMKRPKSAQQGIR